MRHLLILACIIYAAASSIKNEETNKNVEDASEEESDIVFDITQNEEETETAEGRDVIQFVKSEKNGGKAIHIHSRHPPDINIMPVKYEAGAGAPPLQPFPYTAYRPMRYGPQGIKYYRKKQNSQHRSQGQGPKNQVNIYVYFNDTQQEKESKLKIDVSKPTSVPLRHVTLETPGTKPMPHGEGTSGQGTSVQGTVPKQNPTLIAVCPKGHVKVLGACVEYDLD